MLTGKIISVSGSVVDAEFDGGLPRLREALTVDINGRESVMEA